MSERSLSDQKMFDEIEKGREQLLSASGSEGLIRILRRKLESITPKVYVRPMDTRAGRGPVRRASSMA